MHNYGDYKANNRVESGSVEVLHRKQGHIQENDSSKPRTNNRKRQSDLDLKQNEQNLPFRQRRQQFCKEW